MTMKLLLVVLLCLVSTVGSKECSTGASFECPNCDGYQVKQCLDCTGYLNTDEVHNLCINRRLFHVNYEHYHTLWNDIVGAVVWFLVAGVATACGVGGGGIYVPLGILLLRFAPKPASGLSQASIFGASLGGLVLNLPARHPNTKIRNVPVKQHDPDEDSCDDDLSTVVEGETEEEYVEKGGKFYTRPLINYDMALFLAPMEMAGAVLGVLIQKILPNWLYLLIASVVLAATSYKTYKKFWAVHQKEKKEREKNKEAMDVKATEESVVEMGHDDHVVVASNDDGEQQQDSDSQDKDANDVDNHDDVAASKLENGDHETDNKSADKEEEQEEAAAVPEQPPSDTASDAAAADEKPEASAEPTAAEKDTADADTDADAELRQKYLEEDMRQYPREKLIALFVLWVGLLLLTLFKGGKGVESLVGITCESPWYGVLIAFQFLWLFGFALWFGRKLVVKQKEREAVHYPYLDDDPVWNGKSLRFYGIFTFIAGVVAGLIGIGGGMVLGPLMLIMGIHPRVSSATTATMIVLTSSSVAIIFVTSGLVPWSYALFFFLVCFCGAVIGKRKIDGYVKRTGRASLLIFILATIIALATIGCLVIMLTRLADQDWCFNGFNKFCTVDSKESCPANRMLEAFDLLGQQDSSMFVASSNGGY